MSQSELDQASTPSSIWEALVAGNERFAKGESIYPRTDAARRAALLEGQRPRAVVLGCGDSRVPSEFIFDVGFGDLFVVRNAGQVLSDTVLGSIEFAVGSLGTPLVVVLGHESCGAVAGAIAQADPSKPAAPGEHLHELLAQIVPAVHEAAQTGDASPAAVGALHVRRTVAGIIGRSPLVARAVESGTAGIVGANYSLSTGLVTTLDAHGIATQPLVPQR